MFTENPMEREDVAEEVKVERVSGQFVWDNFLFLLQNKDILTQTFYHTIFA